MPVKNEETLLAILYAQRDNIARIATDLVVDGTTGDGEQVMLHGPTPNVIRLYDSPLRMVNNLAMDGWERIVTISPIATDVGARFAQRTDIAFRYHVHMLVRLTDAEQRTDAAQAYTAGVKPLNPLAEKAHRLVYDFHHVFYDNRELVTVDCPSGLVGPHGFNLSWDGEIEYPMALFTAECFGSRASW